MTIDPRISVHEVCFPPSMDVGAMLDWTHAHGIANLGLFSLRRGGDWSGAIAAAARSPVTIAYLAHASMFTLDQPETWAASAASLRETIDAAAAMGAPLVYATTGPSNGMAFEEAVDAFVRAVGPVRDHARDAGVRLLIETTQPNFCFTGFVHSFRDTVTAANAADLDLCFDLWPTWWESALSRTITTAADRIRMVQVSDHIPRNTSVTRDVIGTGIVPVERLLTTVLEAGCDGIVDVELFLRPEETALDDMLASARALTDILTRIDQSRSV